MKQTVRWSKTHWTLHSFAEKILFSLPWFFWKSMSNHVVRIIQTIAYRWFSFNSSCVTSCSRCPLINSRYFMLFLICRSETSVFHSMFEKWKPAVKKKKEIIYPKLMERFIYAQIKILVDPYYYRACHITYLKISQTITYGWFYFNKLILSLSSRILFLNSRSSMLLFFSRRSDYCSIWCVKNGMETHTALGNLLVQICMIWKLLVALSRLSESELEQSTANSAVPCQKDIQLIKCKPKSKNNYFWQLKRSSF